MEKFDLVIKNGLIVNPTKKEPFLGNLGIRNGKIAAVTGMVDRGLSGETEIDASGNVVCPGFIDVHGHIDGCLEGAYASAAQGITTTVGGNCGTGSIDVKGILENHDKFGFPINQAQLIGQSFGVREAAGIFNPYEKASKEQILKMLNIIEEAFDNGAMGMSFGLEYAPGYTWEEILTLTKLAAQRDKIVPIHTNLTEPSDLEHLEEVINLARETGAHIHIAHFVYQYGMGYMEQALTMVEKAMAEGLNVSADSGMYTKFATFVGSAVYDEEHMDKFGWNYDDILVTTGIYAGQRLTPSLYKEIRSNYPNETAICFSGVEEEIYMALSRSYMMMSTDSGTAPSSHPQARGSYPRFFREMVNKRKALSLMEAVRRCTLLPAETFKIDGRGNLDIGSNADIVIFDIEKIEDKADFYGMGDPDASPTGINYLIVNGKTAIKDGILLKDVMNGKTLRYY